MSFDPFESSSDSLVAPAKAAFAITPSDTQALSGATKALFVGTGGDIALEAIGSDSDVIFRNVASGSVLPIRVRIVRSTGTTATDLVGLA